MPRIRGSRIGPLCWAGKRCALIMAADMTMLLAHHWHSAGARPFEPSTGAVGAVLDVSQAKPEWGFLWQQRGRWFAIRKDAESLIFQDGSRWWRLTEAVELRVSRGLFRRFEIFQEGHAVLSLRYVFRGAVHAAIDPTFDAIDEESADFFLYVTQMWCHWKNKRMDTFLTG
jgi:hypothetical protein